MPAALIVDAVDAGDIAQVAAVFDQAVAAGEVPQLVEILEEVRTAIIISLQERIGLPKANKHCVQPNTPDSSCYTIRSHLLFNHVPDC